MKQFYIDLANWVEHINHKSNKIPPKEFMNYVIDTSEELKNKYNNSELFANVVAVHVRYLQDLNPDGLPF